MWRSFRMDYSQQLAIEAATVGAALVPWSYVVSGLLARTKLKGFSVFIAGATFHLLAEVTGLNNYYLRHSAAQMLAERAWPNRNKKVPRKQKKCGIHFCV